MNFWIRIENTDQETPKEIAKWKPRQENNTILMPTTLPIPQDGIDAFGKIITELIDSKLIKTTYDVQGQTTSKDTTTFEWDPWGRLIQVTHPDYT